MTFGTDEIIIVKARPTDIDNIKQITDAYRKELGFVRRPSLLEAIDRSEILVVKQKDIILGFVEYRHRKDEQTTLYNIAITSEYRGMGIGRKLIQSLIKEAKERSKKYILLKCPEDLEANKFYKALHFQLYIVEPDKHRKLNVWRWIL